MTFDSVTFLFFFAAFYLAYNLVSKKVRPIITLVGSYYFYCSINPLFLPIIVTSTIVDYSCSHGIYKYKSKRNIFLIVSLITNLGLLFSFKYYDFFSTTLQQTMAFLGLTISLPKLNLLFPVGISFYTLQTIGYTIDVWRGDLAPKKSYILFSNFVCFFPQLIAGPLERAKDLLPQLDMKKKLSELEVKMSLTFILIGLMKKVVISDRMAQLISFNTEMGESVVYSSKNLITFYLMYFRLYYDFSGYSLMAIGIAGLLGVKLSQNFNAPHFTTSFQGFWRNWHITLHTWFKHYLYIPVKRKFRNSEICAMLVVFFVSGLWHGASWNFIVWGLFNGLCILSYTKIIKKHVPKLPLNGTLVFSIFSGLIVNFFISTTTTFYYIEGFKESINFIQNGFKLNSFRFNDYMAQLTPTQKMDLLLCISFAGTFEAISFFIFKKREYATKLYLKHWEKFTFFFLIILFVFSHQESADFRYYNF